MNAMDIACAAIAVLGAFTTTTIAKTVTFEFVADGSGIQTFDVGGVPAVGGMLTGRFSWDLSARDRNGSEAQGTYVDNASIEFSIEGGPQDGGAFAASDYGAAVNHTFFPAGVSGRSIRLLEDPFPTGTSASFISFLRDVDTISDDLPTSEAELSLDDWDIYAVIQNLDVGGSDYGLFSYRFTDLRQVATAPVPLPASLPLGMMGLGVLGLMATRRRMSAKTA